MKGSIQKHGLSLKRNRPERVTIAFIGWVCLVLVCSIGCARGQDAGKEKNTRPKISAPELSGGTAWLNTAKPISLKDLRGKVVLLDF